MSAFANQKPPARDMDVSKATHVSRGNVKYRFEQGARPRMWHRIFGWIPSQLSQLQLQEMISEGDLTPI